MYLIFGAFISGMFVRCVKNIKFRSSLILFIMLIMFFGVHISVSQFMLIIERIRQYARDWDLRDKTIQTTSEHPQQIGVPRGKYDQDLVYVEMFYESK